MCKVLLKLSEGTTLEARLEPELTKGVVFLRSRFALDWINYHMLGAMSSIHTVRVPLNKKLEIFNKIKPKYH